MYDVGATNANGDVFIYEVEANSESEAIEAVRKILETKLSDRMKKDLSFVAVESEIGKEDKE